MRRSSGHDRHARIVFHGVITRSEQACQVARSLSLNEIRLSSPRQKKRSALNNLVWVTRSTLPRTNTEAGGCHLFLWERITVEPIGLFSRRGLKLQISATRKPRTPSMNHRMSSVANTAGTLSMIYFIGDVLTSESEEQSFRLPREMSAAKVSQLVVFSLRPEKWRSPTQRSDIRERGRSYHEFYFHTFRIKKRERENMGTLIRLYAQTSCWAVSELCKQQWQWKTNIDNKSRRCTFVDELVSRVCRDLDRRYRNRQSGDDKHFRSLMRREIPMTQRDDHHFDSRSRTRTRRVHPSSTLFSILYLHSLFLARLCDR